MILRAADGGAWATRIQQTTQAPTAGGELVERLRRIADPDRAIRQTTMQELLNIIRDPRISEAVLRKLVEGIVALAGAQSFTALGAEARVNILTLLAAIPKERWDAERWIDLKAAARRAIADAAAGPLGGCSEPSQACEQIALIKPKLDWDLASGRTVYFQFAGMVRGDAKAIADRLKALGWSIPGEERTAAAAGYNEVRYGETDDGRAAELLAADLRALGRSGVRAKKVAGIRPNIPECSVVVS